MNAAQRVVLVEGGMGLCWLGYGLLTTPVSSALSRWWVAALAALVAALGTYATDHERAGFGSARQAAVLVGGVLAVVAGTTALVVWTTLSVPVLASAGVGGMGTGLVGYRVVFGVVRPVPEARLESASERAV